PRRDILLGKNLAFAPVVLALGLPVIVVLEVVYPLRFDHLLAVGPQAVSMYLVFCLLANGLSLLAPLPIAAGTLKPTNVKGIPLLLHLAFFFLFPLMLAPVLVPFGIEAALAALGWVEGVPIHLVLSV